MIFALVAWRKEKAEGAAWEEVFSFSEGMAAEQLSTVVEPWKRGLSYPEEAVRDSMDATEGLSTSKKEFPWDFLFLEGPDINLLVFDTEEQNILEQVERFVWSWDDDFLRFVNKTVTGRGEREIRKQTRTT